MRDIKLADLLACEEGGTMLVGEDRSTGRLIHIAEAVRGKACDCVCSSCDRPLIARKGSIRHSFAHYPQDIRRSCMSAGETMLHRYAKELLEREKYILRPRLVATDNLGELTIKEMGNVHFDRVELETRQGNVIPDVVCYLGTRKLYVEFRVTHAVDDEKRLKLRSHDASVLEIDLSDYRDRTLGELDAAILVEAPRKMIQSQLLDRAPELLARRQERVVEELRLRATPLAVSFKRRSTFRDVRAEEWYREMSRHRVHELIRDQEDDGVTCLTVRSLDWKAWVLWQVMNAEQGVTARQLAYHMLKFGWVKDGLFSPHAALCDFVRAEIEPKFLSATELVEHYLNDLKRSDWAVHRGKSRYYVGGALRRLYERIKAELEVPNQQFDAVKKLVEGLVKVLPQAEGGSFKFADWLKQYLLDTCLAANELFASESSAFETLKDKLNTLKVSLASNPPNPDVDLVGLPFASYIEAKRLRWEALQLERQRLAEEREMMEGVARADKLRAAARHPIDSRWSATPIEHDGKLVSPLEHATRSMASASEMHRRLDVIKRQRADVARYMRTKQDSLNALTRQAEKAFGTRERAEVWLRCSNRELGMQRPEEFCVDEATLAACLNVLPQQKRR